jgi:hypothetical protein
MKLWVLLALDEKLARRARSCRGTPSSPIRDEAKSLPSGTMQDEAAGAEHTLREFATQMISISDNTATDHLIDYVGDAGVEKALKLAKHGNPAANIPFLRTRELFGLKLAATADELAAYRKANAGQAQACWPTCASPADRRREGGQGVGRHARGRSTSSGSPTAATCATSWRRWARAPSSIPSPSC